MTKKPMSKDRSARSLPVLMTIVVALMLMLVPLPKVAEPFRPDWIVLVLIFWAMQLPRNWGVITAWCIGIVLDVAQGTLLGQHALAMCVVVFLTVRLHLLMRVFPLLQLTATVFALLALYQFVLFWINGVAGVSTATIYYWAPIVSGTLLWPFLYMFLSGVRYGAPSGG